MCDQSAEQQRDGLSGRQELAMSTLRCRRGLPYEAKSLPSGEEREYHVRVGVPNRKFWLKSFRRRAQSNSSSSPLSSNNLDRTSSSRGENSLSNSSLVNRRFAIGLR